MPRTQRKVKRAPALVSINDIVGANIERLRRTSGDRIIARDKLVADLKEYGIHFSGDSNQGDKLARVEKGTRALDADEMFALSLYFDVPVWAFFVPTADMLSADVQMGDAIIPAVQVLEQLIRPPEGNPEWVPKLKATELALQSLRNNGDPSGPERLLQFVS